MGIDRLSSKQVGSQVSRRVSRRLAWIQPVSIQDMYKSVPCTLRVNPFSAGTAFMLMQTGLIQASRRVTRWLA